MEGLDSGFVSMKITEKEKCEMERGYDPSRFIFQVKRDLLCCICHRVLKEPRLCEAEEHCFCLSCITQYLDKESQTCPECLEPLTLETLKRSQRFLKKVLSELRIRCDYNDRGCLEQVKLRDLKDHVIGCEYRPTVVAEKHSSQVSGKDQQNFCQMKDEFSSKKAEQNELSKKRNEMRGTKIEIQRNPQGLFHSLDEAARDLDITTTSRFPAETKDKLKEERDDMYEEIKIMRADVKREILEVARKQNRMEVKQDGMKECFDEMKQTQKGIKEEVKEVKDNFQMIKQQFERFEGLFSHLLQENIVNRNSAQAMDPTIPANNQDVIILGGWCAFPRVLPLNTVEIYDIVEKRSTMLPPLNHRSAKSASCVYNNDVLVVGGFDGKDGTAKIEVLKMNEHPLRWTMFDGKLPVKLCNHDVIVYQGKLYMIGGDAYNGIERKTSNAIYKIALTPPYTAKLLTRMPEPRRYHKAELVNGKLFILGGTTTNHRKDALDSVVVYDLIKNGFKTCPSLPRPVTAMSTVTWGDKIIVLGGMDKNGRVLDDVIMYDTETGQIEPLPSMSYRRKGCSAVIMNDVIVVFGGRNDEQGYLNSVESFTIGGDGWKELPGMIEKRCSATAVVKPHN